MTETKKKNILEKGYWKQTLSLGFFGWLKSEEVRARQRCEAGCEVRNETFS